MAGRGTVVVAGIGGLVLAMALPPWSAPWVAPVGVGILFVAVGRGTVRRGAIAGFVFGLAFFGLTLWWLSPSISPGAWVALGAVQAGWLALLGAGAALVRRLPGWPVWLAALWTSVEGVRSTMPWGGLPWGRLGYTAVDTPWAGLLAWVGVPGTSAAVALCGALFALVVEARRPVPPTANPIAPATTTPALPRLALVSATTVLGLFVLSSGVLAKDAWAGDLPPPSPATAQLAVIQGEVPGDGTDVPSHHREITRTLLLETRRLAQTSPAPAAAAPDLVVWPENATAVDPATDAAARTALLTASEISDAPVLAGSIVAGPSPTTARNQGIVWTSAGPQARYTKQHLVPFGEYVPLRSLASRISTRVSDIQRDMVPGDPAAPLPVGDLLVADALCFDIAYDDVLREQVAQGAELAVVQTSNAMFLGTAQQEQQWMITRARAIEVGRSVVVSSMNGISGAISPDGSVIRRLPGAQAGGTVVDVPLGAGRTLAVRMGDWPSRAAHAISIAALVVAGLRGHPPRGRITERNRGCRPRGAALGRPRRRRQRTSPCRVSR